MLFLFNSKDGDKQKNSSNGTWISLKDYRNRFAKIESEPKIITHGSEIKISDSILKVFI